MVTNKAVARLIKVYGGLKMSNIITIKGKEISEDTIVEALKKHCGFTEDEPLKAGDVVRGAFGVRIITRCDTGRLAAYDLTGEFQMGESTLDSSYIKIGTLSELNKVFGQ